MGSAGRARGFPEIARKLFQPRSAEDLDAWLERSGETIEGLTLKGWMAFKRTLLVCLAFGATTILLLGITGLIYAVPMAAGVPVLAGSYVASKGRRAVDAEERRILSEAPSVVGTMVMSMHARPSIEGALRAASTCEGGLANRLRFSAWKVLAKEGEGMEGAVLEVASGLSERNDSVRQALHLLLSTGHESGRQAVQRLLDRASRVVIDGAREATDSYVSSLATPTMVLFAVGVLVPVLLFTLVPLQALGSLGASPIDGQIGTLMPLGQLSLIVLVLIPAGTFAYAKSVLARNPMERPMRGLRLTRADLIAIALSACLLAAVTLAANANPYLILLVLGAPIAIELYLRTRAAHEDAKQRRRWGSDLVSGLYQVANRLSCGTSFEAALEQCASDRSPNGFSLFAARVLHRTRVSRMSVEEAIEADEMRGPFPLHWNAFITSARAADTDPVSAGKIAFNLAANLDDLRSASLKIDDSLRGTVDMMRASSAFFAPLVLGVTVGMFGLLQDTGALASGTDGLIIVTGLYVMELAAIISFFTCRLRGAGEWDEAFYDFGTRAPVALTVFISASAFSQSALTQLL